MKAQIQTQVFVYVLSLIIIGAVLLYGYSAISTMRDKGEEIDLISFKTDITREISKMSSDYGSANIITLKVPAGFEQICFIDLNKAPAAGLMNSQPLVYESWADSTANVFLIKDLAEEFHLVHEDSEYLIEINSPGYVCIPVRNNHIDIRLEGIGGKALLSESNE